MTCPYCSQHLESHKHIVIMGITTYLCELAPKDQLWTTHIPIKVANPDSKYGK